jgi:hypothetical protein
MLRLPFKIAINGATLAIGLVAVFSLALIVLVWTSIQPPPPKAPALKPDLPVVIKPEPQPVLDRAALIRMASIAASAEGAGTPLPDQSAMVGRSFSITVRFDCAAPALSWGRDPGQKRIKLSARLQDWSTSDLVKGLAPAQFDQVEGFWVTRPWILTNDCRLAPPQVQAAASAVDRLKAPAAPADGKRPGDKAADAAVQPAPVLPPQVQTLGLASFFSPGASRVPQRGGKPYEAVLKLTPELEAATGSDLKMTLTGRIGQATPGRPVVCRASQPDRRPLCLVAVEIDALAFMVDGVDKPLAEWRVQ